MRVLLRAAAAIAMPALAQAAAAAEQDCQPGPDYRCVETDEGAFGPEPTYEDKPYSGEAQRDIYGGKYMNPTQRPLLEIGQRLYWYGPLQRKPNLLGDANPISPQLLIFGDARAAIAANKNGRTDKGLAAWRLNLDVDLKLTATERIHAFFNPLQQNGKTTRCEFFLDDEMGCSGEFEGEPETYFFEGDLGAITGGIIGRESPFDLPFAGGLVPLLFQNGIWVEDAFFGAAFTVPARNSRTLDISNFDVTFFAGLDRVTSAIDPERNGGKSRIYGVTAFLDASEGYWEMGYGYTEDRTDMGIDYHNLTVAFTRRYRNWLSNSVRAVANVGQDPRMGVAKSANGVMVLIESSFITRRPSTVVPYFNLFVAYDTPKPLARVNGILKNTGILFESDALTGFPFLDDTGTDSVGGALGLEILASDFGWQIVGEVAFTKEHSDSSKADEVGFGLRTQWPLTNALILRVDAMYGIVIGAANKAGGRIELRYKF